MRSIRLGVVCVVALVLAPATASATVVPPGNSAANQYTEAYPTQDGNAPAGTGRHQTSAEALGAKNAKRLEAKGAEGRAAAEAAAAAGPVAQPEGGFAGGGTQQSDKTAASGAKPLTPAGQGSNGASGRPPSQVGDASGGSSGFGEVLGQATGSSSSGRLGLLLPLLIAAVVLWAVAYSFRRRRRVG